MKMISRIRRNAETEGCSARNRPLTANRESQPYKESECTKGGPAYYEGANARCNRSTRLHAEGDTAPALGFSTKLYAGGMEADSDSLPVPLLEWPEGLGVCNERLMNGGVLGRSVSTTDMGRGGSNGATTRTVGAARRKGHMSMVSYDSKHEGWVG